MLQTISVSVRTVAHGVEDIHNNISQLQKASDTDGSPALSESAGAPVMKMLPGSEESAGVPLYSITVHLGSHGRA